MFLVTFAATIMQKMKKYLAGSLLGLVLTCAGFSSITAQTRLVWPSPETEQLYNQARDYLSKGNFRQAIPAYQQVIALAPDQMVAYRDLGNAYYLAGNYEQADKTLDPVMESGKADEQCYQIAAASKKAQKEDKKAKKILSKGIVKYPYSGLLYHQYGKLYDDSNDEQEALKQWIAGINAAPSYRLNYYEAARTYYITTKPVWAIIYGEIFVNMEQLTPRSYETRKMLMAAYRKIFATPATKVQAFNTSGTTGAPDSFEEAVLQTLLKLSPVVSDGITTENLIMLRSRFILDWQTGYAKSYPFTLFSYQDQLLRSGQFDAYNQWLFGKVENATQYESWLKFHPAAMPALEKWMERYPLKPAAGDQYNNGKNKGIFPQNPYKR